MIHNDFPGIVIVKRSLVALVGMSIFTSHGGSSVHKIGRCHLRVVAEQVDPGPFGRRAWVLGPGLVARRRQHWGHR